MNGADFQKKLDNILKNNGFTENTLEWNEEMDRLKTRYSFAGRCHELSNKDKLLEKVQENE